VSKALQHLTSVHSLNVDDDLLGYVPLSPTRGLSRAELEPDEWEYDHTNGHLSLAKTKSALSADTSKSDGLAGIQSLGFKQKTVLKFCDGKHNAACDDGIKVPLLYLKNPNGAKFTSCQGQRAKQKCGGCGFACNSKNRCKSECPKIAQGSAPVFSQSKGCCRDEFFCDCGEGQCMHGGRCLEVEEVEKRLCLSSEVIAVDAAPGLDVCDSGSDEQRWSLQDYRTTWQPRSGDYVIYKKGPAPVHHQALKQYKTCSVNNAGGSTFKGHIQDQIFTEKETLETTGTVNSLQSLISWNTLPPAYWSRDGTTDSNADVMPLA